MKIFYSLLTLLFATIVCGQVGIGTKTPAPTAALEVYSTNQGFLPPRMTKTEMEAVGTDIVPPTTPATGSIVYCTSNDCDPIGLYHFNGTIWVPVRPSFSLVEIDPTPINPNGFTGVFVPNVALNSGIGTFFTDQTKRATFRVTLKSPSGVNVSFKPKFANLNLSGIPGGSGIRVADIDYQTDSSGGRVEIPGDGEPTNPLTINGGLSGYLTLYYQLEGTFPENFSVDIPFSINEPAVKVSFTPKLDIPPLAQMFSYKRLYQNGCSLTPSNNTLFNLYEGNNANSVATISNATTGSITTAGGAEGATAYVAAREIATQGTGDYKLANTVVGGGRRDFDFASPTNHQIKTDITMVYAIAIGGGGSGGGASTVGPVPPRPREGGAGGGGGGTTGGVFSPTSGGQNMSITVGGGGGEAAAGSEGNGGNSSSITYLTSSITGGGGFGGQGASSTNNGGQGGGTTIINGGNLVNGWWQQANGADGQGNFGDSKGGDGGGAGSIGGGSWFGIGVNNGSGGAGNIGPNTGQAGSFAGGGGAGGGDGSVTVGGNNAGGAGSSGFVRILYACPTP